MTHQTLGVRRPLRTLQRDFEQGDKQPLRDLVTAFDRLQKLPPTDHRSFFMLAGYHGEPFQYRRDVDALSTTDTYQYWGGYCNHGNVLFPTWHRVYVLKLEQALQEMVPGVMMPYWDETSDETLNEGIPWVLTAEEFEIADGEYITNPLRSFTLPVALSDDLGSDDREYEKPKGYETVRYPMSGLVGTPEARAATDAHNAEYPHEADRRALLNRNIEGWMATGATSDDPSQRATAPGVRDLYVQCLAAPDYTVFSNTTSAAQYNLDSPGGSRAVALESPHNDVHLAVGGFDVPGQGEFGVQAGANGDMGENNTAAMDPIFFFHHCFVDRVFWMWQQLHDQTTTLSIRPGYAGTDNAADGQGPTPGLPPGTRLDTDTPLNPFVKDEFGNVYTSEDCVDIEALGYTYEDGSLPALAAAAADSGSASGGAVLEVSGIDRAHFQGSFVIRAYASVEVPDANRPGRTMRQDWSLGHHSVLSRRNIVNCANCLTHLEVHAHFPLDAMPPDLIDQATFRVEIQHRGEVLPDEFAYTATVKPSAAA